MRYFTVLLFGLSFCLGVTANPADSETVRLNTFLNAQYEEELSFSPIKLSRLGRKTAYDQIDDFSEAADIAEYRWRRQSVDQMKRDFDYDRLSPEGRISYDYWLYRLDIQRRKQPYLNHHYWFNQEWGMHTELPQFLINVHRVDSEQDMRAYISRIKGISHAILQGLERTQRAVENQIRLPGFNYASAIEASRRLVSGAPFTEDAAEDSPLWSDANTKISALVTNGQITSSAAEKLRKQTEEALKESLLPAYQALSTWLQQDLPNADKEARGVSALPKGGGYYNFQLSYYTTTNMSPEEIHELGLREVERIRGDMEAIKKQVGFEGGLAEFFDYVRDDVKFYLPDTDAGRQACLDRSVEHLDWMTARLPQYFGILPKAELVVKRVEPFLERDGGSPFYKRSTADGTRPGTYYLHLSDMSAINTISLETDFYHEGYPGHHMQVAIALERSDLPLFRTNVWYSAYAEGWALYAELLAKEMGAFSEPYSDFGRLQMEMWRAVRLVVDTGIHAKNWTESQAVEYFLANSSTPEVSARAEIRRYFIWPGQATSYKIGMLKILEMRERAKSVLGDRFDIREYHDTILGGGSLPLAILERRVDNWIDSQSSATVR
jgi:uncharacterized protein (DUF885 family)